MKKFLFFVFLALAGILIFRRELCGRFLEKRLAGTLTSVFGMPVTIEGLRVDPLSGHVRASHLRFMNQPEFSPAPHFDVSGLQFDVNFWAIRDKEVLIKNVEVERPVFFMESIPKDKHDSISNVRMWYRHIRVKFNLDAPDEPEPPGYKRWHIKIDPIVLHHGVFLFRNDKAKRRFYFANLEASLTGFERPTDPAKFPQNFKAAGTFGTAPPAPVWVKGKVNFATSDVGFDLEGEIKEGSLAEQKMFLHGLPIKVTAGTYHLKSKLYCLRGDLDAENSLDIKDIKARTMKTPESLIWGVPALGFVGLLQKEAVIHLEPPVRGDISDPKFGFTHAFRVAFQEALRHHTTAGLKMIEEPVKKVAQTGGMVMEAPAKMMGEQIEKISTLVKNLNPSPNPEPVAEKAGEKKSQDKENGHG